MPTPPPVFSFVARVSADRRFRDEILDNLEEEFREQVELRGEAGARRWYRAQVLRSLGPLLRWRISRQDTPWRRAVRRVAWSPPGQDVKYALRSLRGSLGFSVVVVLTFALGIGVNTAVFSLIHSLVLDPLPFPGGDRLVQLWRYEVFEDGRRALFPPAPPMVAAWKEEDGLFQRMGAYREEEFHVSEDGGVTSWMGARVSPEILSMVSATALMGRLFGPADAIPGSGNVVVVPEDTWTRRFGSDPGIIGRTLMVNGTPHTVVGVASAGLEGVMEAGFFGSQPKEILLPLSAHAGGGWSGNPNVVARLGPGVSVELARERLEAIQTAVAPLIEGENEWFVQVVTPREALAPGFRQGLWVVFGGVGIVLLIACGNIATLLLVRRTSRGREMEVRLALGAGRSRLAGQLFTESLLLGGAGILLAILSAGWMLDAAMWIGGGALPELRSARLDPVTLAFGAGAGFLTVLAFSLIPILHLGSLRPAGALVRERPRERQPRMGWMAHRILVVGQVALATVLVLSAGLLSNSLLRLLSVDPGFETRGLAAVAVELPTARYDAGMERIAFFDDVVRGLETAPGVEAVGWARFVPPRVAGAPGRILLEGRPPPEERRMEAHAGNWVSPSYFGAVGVPFLEGRPFTDAEISERAEVVIINRSAARRLWPEGDGGIGSRIQLDSDLGPSPWMTVVGIVPDFKAWWLGDRPDRLQIYLPVSNVPPPSAVILIRGSGRDLGALVSLVQTQVTRLDPNLPVGETFWVGDAFRQSVARQRFQTLLLSSFGIIGLVLAVLGVYGILSLSVTRRTREIAVRSALGATPGDVERKVLGQGARAVAAGAALGLGLSFFTSHLLSDLLWGIEDTDPLTYLACVGAVVLAGLTATYVSTRRALDIDPVEALKRE